jgi:pyruvate formate lyase activating enzyme
MRIGGLEKLTLIDYPGHLAAIVFTQGCNFRCHFCYNPQLVWPRSESSDNIKEKGYLGWSQDDLFLFLAERKEKLNGVVITGGEPTLHPDLPDFIRKIKDLGYDVKLDSNGTNPDMLEYLIKEGLIDYIAMDIKAPLDKYEQVVGAPVDLRRVEKSVRIIKESGLPYEFRSTLVPQLLNEEDIEAMGRLIEGARAWYLQDFKSDTELVNGSFRNKQAFPAAKMDDLAKIGQRFVPNCQVRR